MSKQIPAVPRNAPPELVAFLTAVRNALQDFGSNGAPVNEAQVVEIVNDAIEAGTIDVESGGSATYATVPPALTGLTADGGLGVVFLNWNTTTYAGFDYVKVYRAGTNNSSLAEFIGVSRSTFYPDYVGDGVTRYYWVSIVSLQGTEGPLNATSGVSGTAATDPSYVLDVLAGSITETELFSTLSTRINLIDDGAGVAGSVNARIATEATTRANADTAISATVTTLSATVSGHTATIATHATAIATAQGDIVDLYAEYTVKIDVNGYVAGFGLAVNGPADGPTTSTFIILADEFAVAFPSATWLATQAYSLNQFVVPTVGNSRVYKCTTAGTSAGSQPTWPTTVGNTVADGTVVWTCTALVETVPFVIGTVGGISTVGINGNLVVDGTIVANTIAAGAVVASKISVTSLSAVSANMGTVTSGLFQTATSGYRAEMDSTSSFPFWYGTGTKNTTNGLFYVDNAGAAVFKGALSAATGSFAGSLTAATGSFAGSLTAATGTLGTIEVSTTGHVRGGMSAYATGEGFWLGYSGSEYKFSVGNASGNMMTYDGTSFKVTGDVFFRDYVAGATVTLLSSTSTVAEAGATPVKKKEFRLIRKGTVRVEFEAWCVSSDVSLVLNGAWSIYNGSTLLTSGSITATGNTSGGINGDWTFSEDVTMNSPDDTLEIRIGAGEDSIGAAPARIKNAYVKNNFYIIEATVL